MVKPSLLNFILKIKMRDEELSPENVQEFEEQLVKYYKSFYKAKVVEYLTKMSKKMELEMEAFSDYFERLDVREVKSVPSNVDDR